MKKETTSIQVWKESRDKLKALAEDQGISMKKLIDNMAIKYVKKNK